MNGETGISEADRERGENPHAEGCIAWPSCLPIVSLISAYSLSKTIGNLVFTLKLHVKALVDLDNWIIIYGTIW